MDKLSQVKQADQYLINNWLNDVFGACLLLTVEIIEQVVECLNDWQEELGLKN